jgi:Ca2+-binding RTX toxin-like protein
MKTLAAAAALGTLLTGATLVAPAAQAAETCRGLAATIVDTGAPGYLVGTAGDDVIVTHGSPVRALAGNDVICGDGSFVGVEAGPGDDLVDLSAVKHAAAAELAGGNDTFVGGPAIDTVYGAFSGDFASDQPEPKTPDVGIDVISTGAGLDRVSSGSGLEANHDRIDVGPGDDEVTLVPTESDGSLDLGDGANVLALQLDSTTAEAWTVNASLQSVEHDSGVMLWTGTTARYVMASRFLTPSPVTTPPSSLLFLGTPSDDVVRLPYPAANLQATLRMRGGDDDVLVEDKTAPGSIYSLGPGRDSLVVNPFDSYGDGPVNRKVRVDLDDHRLDYGSRASASVVNSVDELRVSGVVVRASGNEADNSIFVTGCDVRATGRAGDDLVRRTNSGFGGCPGGPPNRLSGGPGDDHLVGTRLDDVLLGGGGYDVANGGSGGDDTCVAEVRKGCRA